MDGRKLQERAAERCQELPGTELTHPFGDDWDVYKVGGKMFMLQTVVSGEPVVILKAAPADSLSLRAAFDDVTPGYHMNKKHWITLHAGGGLDAPLLDDLVTDSYLRVVENLPQKQRPVDLASFAESSKRSEP